MHRLLVSFGVCLLVVTAGCNKAAPKPDTPAPGVKGAGSHPTTEEVQQFADKMTKAVEAADSAEINRLIRLLDLVERSISDFGLSDKQRRSFMHGLSEALPRGTFGDQILKASKDGSYKLLRIHNVDGRQRALFRMLGADGEVSYHDYTLARYPDGEVATEDIYIYLTGEPFSQTMRRLLAPMLESKGFRGRDAEQLKNSETLKAMTQAMRAGKFEQAMAQYHTLPKKVQEEKAILIYYTQAAKKRGEAGERDYLAAMELFRKLYPKDASVDFISIDYFCLKKQFDAATGAIDRLDQAIGGDPYLNLPRGTVHLEAGRFGDARAAYEKAIQLEPELTDAYWVRIGLAVKEKNHTDTLTWLKAIVEKRSVELQDLINVPQYAEFVKSPQHTEWQKWYAERRK
jgi:tetratricopeptide (TPR) repeat protein